MPSRSRVCQYLIRRRGGTLPLVNLSMSNIDLCHIHPGQNTLELSDVEVGGDFLLIVMHALSVKLVDLLKILNQGIESSTLRNGTHHDESVIMGMLKVVLKEINKIYQLFSLISCYIHVLLLLGLIQLLKVIRNAVPYD